MLLVRKFAVLAPAMALFACAHAAEQWSPTRPVRLVVPFAAGGTIDLVGRLLAIPLTRSLGQNVIVDDRPGGGTVIGVDVVARAPADGHTVLLMGPSFTINPFARSKLPYDTAQDFTGVAGLAANPLMFSVHPSLPGENAARADRARAREAGRTHVRHRQPDRLPAPRGGKTARGGQHRHRQRALFGRRPGGGRGHGRAHDHTARQCFRGGALRRDRQAARHRSDFARALRCNEGRSHAARVGLPGLRGDQLVRRGGALVVAAGRDRASERGTAARAGSAGGEGRTYAVRTLCDRPRTPRNSRRS